LKINLFQGTTKVKKICGMKKTRKRLFRIKRYFCGTDALHMRKSGFLIILFLVIAGLLPAQDVPADSAIKKKSRMTIDFNGAYSIPLGKYKPSDQEDDNPGYAGGGLMAQIKLNWLGKRDLGLGISYIFQQNWIPKEYQDIVIPGGNPNGLGDKPWSNHYLMAGPVLLTEFPNKVVIDAAILVGFVVASSHVFDMTVPVDTIGTTMTSSGAGTGFAYQIRAGVGYRVGKRIILTGGFSLTGGSPKRTKSFYSYSYVEDPPGSNNYIYAYQGYEETIKHKIASFNPGIGLIIKL
jgi:hypothetical protein